jgi:hypothetical protein
MSDLVEKLGYLQCRYIKSREAIALLENYDKDKKSYIGPHNELRNALDHIMRMVEAKDDETTYNKEFNGAESHLLRAGYDAYELICINQIDYIKRILNVYSTVDISIGFPDYYKDIRPNIINIEKETAKIREVKRQETISRSDVQDSILGGDTYGYYFNAASKLINYVKQIDNHLPIINECYRERIAKEQKNQKASKIGYILGIIGVAIGIIGVIIAFVK